MDSEITVKHVLRFEDCGEIEQGHYVWMKVKYLLAGLSYANVAGYCYLARNLLNETLTVEEKKTFIQLLEW